MEKLNNDKFQKLNEFKIDNLDLVRGGWWIARTRQGSSSDHIAQSYSWADGSWTETATSKRNDYAKYLMPG